MMAPAQIGDGNHLRECDGELQSTLDGDEEEV
jgi:hypothetical protein